MQTKRLTQKGEIATFLTVASLVIMIAGVLTGSRIARTTLTQDTKAQVIPTSMPRPNPRFKETEKTQLCESGFRVVTDPFTYGYILTTVDGPKKEFVMQDTPDKFGKKPGTYEIFQQFNEFYVDFRTGNDIHLIVRYSDRADNGKRKVDHFFWDRSVVPWLDEELAKNNVIFRLQYYTRNRENERFHQDGSRKGPCNGPTLTLSPSPTTISGTPPTGTVTVTPSGTLTVSPTASKTPTPSTTTTVSPSPSKSPTPTIIGGKCPLKIKAYVKKCANASCPDATATVLGEFDLDTNFGTSNDYHRAAKPRGGGFGDTPMIQSPFAHPPRSSANNRVGSDIFGNESGAIWLAEPDWQPKATDFYQRGDRAKVHGYFNGDKYDIVKVKCEKKGGSHAPCPFLPGGGILTTIDKKNLVSRFVPNLSAIPESKDWLIVEVPDLLLDCDVDYEYGWYLIDKKDQPQACYFRPRTFVKYQEKESSTPQLISNFSSIGSTAEKWGVINEKLAKETADNAKLPFDFRSNFNNPDNNGKYDPCKTAGGSVAGCNLGSKKTCCGGAKETYTVNADQACVTLFSDSNFEVTQKCEPNYPGGKKDIANLERINFDGDDYTCKTISKTDPLRNSTANPATPNPAHPNVICGLPISCSERGVRYEYGWVVTKKTNAPTPTPCSGENCQPSPTRKPTSAPKKTTFQLDVEGLNLPTGHNLANPCFVVADTENGLINKDAEAEPRPCLKQEVDFKDGVVNKMVVAFHNVLAQPIQIAFQLNSCKDSETEKNAKGRTVCNVIVPGASNRGNPERLPAGKVYECVWTNPKDNPHVNCSIKDRSQVSTTTSDQDTDTDTTDTDQDTTTDTTRAQKTEFELRSADVVLDRSINTLDAGLCLSEWGQSQNGRLPANAKCDLNQDGDVNSQDSSIVWNLFGTRY